MSSAIHPILALALITNAVLPVLADRIHVKSAVLSVFISAVLRVPQPAVSVFTWAAIVLLARHMFMVLLRARSAFCNSPLHVLLLIMPLTIRSFIRLSMRVPNLQDLGFILRSVMY